MGKFYYNFGINEIGIVTLTPAMTNDIQKYVFLSLIYERHQTNLNCIRDQLLIRNFFELEMLEIRIESLVFANLILFTFFIFY